MCTLFKIVKIVDQESKGRTQTQKLDKFEYLRTLCGKALKNLVWVER